MSQKIKTKSLRPVGTMSGHALTIELENMPLYKDGPYYGEREIVPHGSGDTIDRDPFEQRKFAQTLLDCQGELLEVCWSMREKLEQAKDYVTGMPAWPVLIEQGIELTAELQKTADCIRAIGEFEKKHADYLIHQMEEFYK